MTQRKSRVAAGGGSALTLDPPYALTRSRRDNVALLREAGSVGV